MTSNSKHRQKTTESSWNCVSCFVPFAMLFQGCSTLFPDSTFSFVFFVPPLAHTSPTRSATGPPSWWRKSGTCEAEGDAFRHRKSVTVVVDTGTGFGPQGWSKMVRYEVRENGHRNQTGSQQTNLSAAADLVAPSFSWDAGHELWSKGSEPDSHTLLEIIIVYHG